MTSVAARVVVLDRDGVINVDLPGRYVCSADEWIPLPGSIDAIAQLANAGYDVFVVSNQSGIGRGFFTEQDLAAMHAKFLGAVESAGGRIAGWFYCPHTPEDQCKCRKPETGLLESVAATVGSALEGVAFIGDKWSDLLAARRLRMRGLLVGTGHGGVTLQQHAGEVSEYFVDLAAASRALLAGRAEVVQ